MPQILTDLIEPQLLIDYVRQWDIEVNRPTAQFTLDTYLPDQLIDDLEFRVRKGGLNDTDAAQYRSWDTQPIMTDRPGVSRISGSLGPVSRQIPLSEEEHLQLRSLRDDTNDPIIQAIYDDSERMIRSVQARLELARGDLIDDGAVTIQENNLTLTADFGRSTAFKPVVSTYWTDPTSPILSDLLGYLQTYLTTNGVMPAEMLMSYQRLANLALNNEMRNYAAANGTIPSRLNRATINEIFAAEGLPPITLYDTTVRIDGVATRVLPARKVYLMPPTLEPLGKTFFSVTAEALFLAQRGLIDQSAMPGIVAVVLQNENPVQKFTLGTAIALPAMPNPDLVMSIQVTA